MTPALSRLEARIEPSLSVAPYVLPRGAGGADGEEEGHGGAVYELQGRLAGSLGLGAGVEALLAVLLDSKTMRVDGPDTEHHRDETLAGVPDVQAGLRGVWRLDTVRFAPSLALSIPVDPQPRNPGAEGEGGSVVTHEHMRTGNGTYDVLAGLDGFAPLGPRWAWLVGATARAPLANDPGGYRPGNELAGSLGVAWLGGGRLTPALRAWLAHRGEDAWDDEPVQSSGRTDVAVEPFVSFSPVRRLALLCGVRFPVWVSVGGAQFVEPAVFTVGLAWVLGRGKTAGP